MKELSLPATQETLKSSVKSPFIREKKTEVKHQFRPKAQELKPKTSFKTIMTQFKNEKSPEKPGYKQFQKLRKT